MIKIGTRGSKLALVQANWVSGKLSERGLANRIEVLKTKGDVVQDRFDKMEGKGFFTKEIEDALLEGQVDLAVHSLKDVPTESPKGLVIATIPERANADDVLIAKNPIPLAPNRFPDLSNLLIGTSSLRRVMALKRFGEHVRFAPIRGNVPTRIAKMERGETDIVVLARAGLDRLGLDLGHLSCFSARPPFLVPAPGQGALAIQTREGFETDLSFLHHELSARCVLAERSILKALEGGCQLPLGVLIRRVEDGTYRLDLFRGFQDATPICLNLQGPSPEALAETALVSLSAVRS